jgi:hypothetical protein
MSTLERRRPQTNECRCPVCHSPHGFYGCTTYVCRGLDVD